MDWKPVLLALAFLTAPTTWASDDPAHGHAAYVTGAAVAVALVESPPTPVCSDACPLGLPAIGGAVIAPEDGRLYHDVLVQFDDAHWGENAAYQVCPVIADPPQPACGFDAFVGCGTTILFVPIVHLAAVEVEVYALYVQEGLQLCGATSGEILAAFFHPHPN